MCSTRSNCFCLQVCNIRHTCEVPMGRTRWLYFLVLTLSFTLQTVSGLSPNTPVQQLDSSRCDSWSSICTDIYAPVCGIDNVTYLNGCYASRACMEVAYEGKCEDFQGPRPLLVSGAYLPKLSFVCLCCSLLAFVFVVLDHCALPSHG